MLNLQNLEGGSMADKNDSASRKTEIEKFFEEIEKFSPTPLITKEVAEEIRKRQVRKRQQYRWPNTSTSNGTSGAVTNANLG